MYEHCEMFSDMLPVKKLLGADGRVHCPHYEETVGKRTYWRHKHLYYNLSTDHRQTAVDRERVSDSEEESVQSCPSDDYQPYLELDDHPGDDTGNPLQSVSSSLQLLATYGVL